jgi:putative nucleotidyltransferase with HDIG domain
MDKKPLNPQIAEEFARRTFEKLPLEEDREFNKTHAKSMVETVEILANGKKVDIELIETACWLHDIGKTVEMDNHAIHSLEILEKEEFEINEKLKDCILNHGNGGNPQCLEAQLIQIADKACMINPKIIEILTNFTMNKPNEEKTKDLEFVRKLLNNAVDLLKKS